MPVEVRTCPHCGMLVSGDTERCPRCDNMLNESPSEVQTPESELPAMVEDESAVETDGHTPDEEDNPPESFFEAVTENTPLDLRPVIIEKPPESQPATETGTPHIGADDRTEIDSSSDSFDSEAVTELPGSDALDSMPYPHVPEPPALETQNRMPVVYEGDVMEDDLPPAPYTPPPFYNAPEPLAGPPPPQQQQPSVPQRPSDYWLKQRIQAYGNAFYQVKKQTPYEVMMTGGKSLPLFWWIVGTMSVVGMAWYFLILLFSFFRKDKVFIYLESDGYVFEEGAAAAHVRKQRWRISRRWAVAGLILLVLSMFMIGLLMMATSVVGDRYRAEIEQAYPELTFYESTGEEDIPQNQVEEARIIVLVFVVFFNLAFLGILLGYLLTMIGYIQAAAYHTKVQPLPGLR